MSDKLFSISQLPEIDIFLNESLVQGCADSSNTLDLDIKSHDFLEKKKEIRSTQAMFKFVCTIIDYMLPQECSLQIQKTSFCATT